MLYRFNIDLSDIDRGVYEKLDFRVAQHPSEVAIYLLTRVLAYALSYQENLEFAAGGLSDPDAPALRANSMQGATELWIEIGNPAARKLHKATKSSKQVVVYTYKNAELLIQEIKTNDVHRAEDIKIISFETSFLNDLEKHLDKNNHWSVMLQQSRLDVMIKDLVFSVELKKW